MNEEGNIEDRKAIAIDNDEVTFETLYVLKTMLSPEYGMIVDGQNECVVITDES